MGLGDADDSSHNHNWKIEPIDWVSFGYQLSRMFGTQENSTSKNMQFELPPKSDLSLFVRERERERERADLQIMGCDNGMRRSLGSIFVDKYCEKYHEHPFSTTHSFHVQNLMSSQHEDYNKNQPMEFYDFLQINTESNKSEVIDNARRDDEEVNQQEQHKKAAPGVPLFFDFLSIGSSSS
ncbi:transcriptional activator Myb-like [Tripterygium wilfordii]|uniref:Transcriptional activator Myb-like n=1 Tax=Tripterygium wilfordii TaxID=458696 RepID=A0A7J7CJ85_TRIWF|nr:transcriptional activator Myb-like [Tripterygium wilfordii]